MLLSFGICTRFWKSRVPQIKWCNVQPSFWTFLGQFNASQITQHLKHESETRSFSSHWPQNVTISNFDKIERSTSTRVTPLDRPFVPSTVLTRMMQWQPVPTFRTTGHHLAPTLDATRQGYSHGCSAGSSARAGRLCTSLWLTLTVWWPVKEHKMSRIPQIERRTAT